MQRHGIEAIDDDLIVEGQTVVRRKAVSTTSNVPAPQCQNDAVTGGTPRAGAFAKSHPNQVRRYVDDWRGTLASGSGGLESRQESGLRFKQMPQMNADSFATRDRRRRPSPAVAAVQPSLGHRHKRSKRRINNDA
jgi:hypothetical protein